MMTGGFFLKPVHVFGQKENVGDFDHDAARWFGDVLPVFAALRSDSKHPAFLLARAMAAKHRHHVGSWHSNNPGHRLLAARHCGNTGHQRQMVRSGPSSQVGGGTTPAGAGFGERVKGFGRERHRAIFLTANNQSRASTESGRKCAHKQSLVRRQANGVRASRCVSRPCLENRVRMHPVAENTHR